MQANRVGDGGEKRGGMPLGVTLLVGIVCTVPEPSTAWLRKSGVRRSADVLPEGVIGQAVDDVVLEAGRHLGLRARAQPAASRTTHSAHRPKRNEGEATGEGVGVIGSASAIEIAKPAVKERNHLIHSEPVLPRPTPGLWRECAPNTIMQQSPSQVLDRWARGRDHERRAGGDGVAVKLLWGVLGSDFLAKRAQVRELLCGCLLAVERRPEATAALLVDLRTRRNSVYTAPPACQERSKSA